MIENEENLSRVATNLALIAGAISTLAEAVNGTYKGKPIYTQQETTAPSIEPATQKRGRGRQAKGEENGVAVAPTVAATATTSVTPTASVEAEDPFADAPKPPAAAIDEVRAALKALQNATTQANALHVLKASGNGAANLTDLKSDFYGAVVAAATAALPVVKTEPVVEDDPFGENTPVAQPEAVKITIEDIKAAVVAAQKITSQDTVQKVVMSHGGKANVAGQPPGPSLKALPEANYAACLAEIKALPKTK